MAHLDGDLDGFSMFSHRIRLISVPCEAAEALLKQTCGSQAPQSSVCFEARAKRLRPLVAQGVSASFLPRKEPRRPRNGGR